MSMINKYETWVGQGQQTVENLKKNKTYHLTSFQDHHCDGVFFYRF